MQPARRHTLTLAAALACAGLAATANAQHADAPKAKVSSSTTIINSDGDNAYEIRIEDGTITTFKLNGETVDPSQYKLDEEGGFIVLKDGNAEPIIIDIPTFSTNHFFGGGTTVAPFTPFAPAAPEAPDAIDWFDQPEPADPTAMAWAGEEPPKVMIGITHDEVSHELREKLDLAEGEGIYVLEVRKELPADKAGIKSGDIIIEVDGQRLEQREILMEILKQHEPGDTLKVLVLRDGEEKKVKLELAPFDPGRLNYAGQGRTRVFTPSAPGQHRIRINDDNMDFEGLAEIEIEGLEGLEDLEIFGDFDFDFDMEGLPPEAQVELEKALKLAHKQAAEAHARAFTLRRDANGQRRLLELHARNHEEAARGLGEHAEEMRHLEERLAKLRELGENDRLFRAAPNGRAFIIERDDNDAPRAAARGGSDQLAEKLRALSSERDTLSARNRELEARVQALEEKLETLMKKIERSQ